MTTDLTIAADANFKGATMELLKADNTFLAHRTIASHTTGADAKIMLTMPPPAGAAKFKLLAPSWEVGTAPSRIVSGNVANPMGMTFKIDKAIHESASDQFQGGTIELRKADGTLIDKYNITGNTTGDNPTITISAAVPADAANFTNLEDDDIAHAITAADMQVDTSLWESKYEPALVKVNTTKVDLSPNDGNNVNEIVPFATNIDTAADAKNYIKAQKQSEGTQDFWVIYQVGAFQVFLNRDRDPGSEEAFYGISSVVTLPTTDSEAGTFLFAETYKDALLTYPDFFKTTFSNWKKIDSVHESGHEFRMFHVGFGTLMEDGGGRFKADTPEKIDALTFSGSGYHRIMITASPGTL